MMLIYHLKGVTLFSFPSTTTKRRRREGLASEGRKDNVNDNETLGIVQY
jgi:hypothetical protein